jgi:hypothetical protein
MNFQNEIHLTTLCISITHFLHITVHILQNIMTHHYKIVMTSCVSIYTPSSYDNIFLMQTKNQITVRQLPILLWEKGISLVILVITATHIIPITVHITQTWDINTRISSPMASCTLYYILCSYRYLHWFKQSIYDIVATKLLTRLIFTG